MIWSRVSLAIGALLVFVELCAGQDDLATTWATNQKNITWCQWASPRAAVIRDTLYVDGGALRTYPGLNDGSYGEFSENGNPFGLVYMLNFSIPFETSANFSEVFTNMSKAGSGFANNIAPNFYDGAMLANDYEWITYGGLVAATAAADAPGANWFAKFMQYLSGPSRPFAPGWQVDTLDGNVTRYVSSGASASVPSENLGFYFGGLRAADWGAIDTLPGNASTLSTTLIEVDMTTQNQESWRNLTLPRDIAGRANAELVWVPVSEKGVLIAVGGVINPSFATPAQALNATETLESKRVSPGFMTTVAIYDIANEVWYEQETSGNTPGQLTQGCTVVASAADGSSHNIYWYGGYDGVSLTSSDSFNDDVWVLSVPSFIWTKLKSGEVKHARAGHKCVKPYPDQMIVFGGYTAPTGIVPKCVDGGMVQIFNLSSAQWIDTYDPTVWNQYSVPQAIYEKIGGSEKGGATQLTPTGGFDNSSLATVFSTEYDNNKIKTYFPFKKADPKNETPPGLLPTPTPNNNSGTPSYLAPVLGVVLGLFFITLIILAVLLFRRRKLLRSQTATMSEAGTIEQRRWIDNWLIGQPAPPIVDKDAPTTTTDETPMTAYEEEHQVFVQPPVPEIGGGQVYEMPDTSHPVELHGQTSTDPSGLVPLAASGLRPSPSAASRTSHTSTVSHISNNSLTRPAISPTHSDFSPIAQSPEEHTERRIVSDMSGISEMERGHLRGISETSVSTIGGGAGSVYATPGSPHSPFGPDSYVQVRERERSIGRSESGDNIMRQDGGRPSLVSPLSPSGGEGGQAEDYLSARPSPSMSNSGVQRRRSNFQEEGI